MTTAGKVVAIICKQPTVSGRRLEMRFDKCRKAPVQLMYGNVSGISVVITNPCRTP